MALEWVGTLARPSAGLLLLLAVAAHRAHAEGAASLPSVELGARTDTIGAIGRIEPRDGIIQVAGPSQPVVVVSELLVDKGDRVQKGQIIAVLDTLERREADVARARAELANAEAEFRRNSELHDGRVISDSLRDSRKLNVDVAKAELRLAEAELELSRVRSPIDGTVIEVHAREGERVEDKGILELARTDEMFAIAEVYETEVRSVRVGQRAHVWSPAFEKPLEGTVERIGMKVGKLDSIGADPAAKTDARVVEVEIRLDRSELAARYTNLQVEVEIQP